MIKQFIVTLMNLRYGIYEHRVNCANAESAKYISETIFDGFRVIDVRLA